MKPTHTTRNPALTDAVLAQLNAGEDEKCTLKDIANHGADSGWSGFTYTADTVEFFDANRAAILALTKEDSPTVKNALAWFALESVARELTD